jgi:hypothetical protein
MSSRTPDVNVILKPRLRHIHAAFRSPQQRSFRMTRRASMIRNPLKPRPSLRATARGKAALGMPRLFVTLLTAGVLAAATLGIVSTVALAG